MASIGIGESLTGAPATRQAPYWYRAGMGLVPSAEWDVFFDDFHQQVTSNVPAGWAAAIIDSGATVTQWGTATTATGTGVISFASSTASQGAAIYLPKAIKLRTGKRVMVEARVYTNDVTDNAIQIGLSVLTATSNPEDLWTTATADGVAFGILDGSATTQLFCDENNGGTSVIAGSRVMTADTWQTLAIFYDGYGIYAFVDGKLSAQELTTANIPENDVLLAPFIGALNGNGAGGNTNLCDYFRVVAER